MPGRQFPGVLLQGDSPHILRSAVAEVVEACEQGDLEEARESAGLLLADLDALLTRYEAALGVHPRFRGRTELSGHHLGKRPAFGTGSRAGLDAGSGHCHAALGGSHRDSPLLPPCLVRLWCVPGRCVTAAATRTARALSTARSWEPRA
ncbi:DUF6959 family protein [Streptomyces sp. NPDC048253]|uniref:DUF6959 family protein n=1 Tax=Streptomyces sp. NPDC048253 TaxID=3365524 RepID=UPI003720355F